MKSILAFGGCIVGTVLVLASLFKSSTLNEEWPRQPFERNFSPAAVISQESVMDLTYNSFYIAGASNKTIYLGNWTAPFHLLAFNYFLSDTQHVALKIKHLSIVRNPRKFRLKIDSPYFYLANGVQPAIYRGELDRWIAAPFMSDRAYFVDAIPIGHRSFALRSYNLSNREFELAKETDQAPYFWFRNELLQKQVDGFFCVEGSMHFSDRFNRLVYLYAFRNEFMVLDTSLNVINRFHTIDTFAHANIKVARIKARHEVTLAEPPARINGKSSVSGKYIFIESHLLAKNENEDVFKHSTVLDVYDFLDGRYLCSIHVPEYRQRRITDFKVVDGYLVAIYEKFLVVYVLSLKNTTGRSGIQG